MRSVPLALTWELLQRGRWNLILAAVGANALPVLLLEALRRQGLDLTDHAAEDEPAFLTMHIVLLQVMMFTFGATVFSAQGEISRLYAYPIPNTTLVAWHMLPAMILAALESLASIAALNAAFGLNWPLWGPSLFLAVAVAAFQASIWLTGKTPWIVVSTSGAAAVLGLWFRSRYGAMFGQSTHWWREVTPGEVLALGGMFAVSYVVGVWGVARQRRGESIPALGIVAWFERVFDAAPQSDQSFPTPTAAQFWAEWTKKGWAIPAAVAFCVVAGTSCWLLFSGNPTDLIEGYLVGGGLLTLAGILGGLLIGNCGSTDENYAMGSFLATRPLTNSELAQMILKVSTRSVFVGWLIWMVVAGLLFAALVPTQLAPLPKVWGDLRWWYFPATILGPWLALTVFATLGLTGRSGPMFAFVSVVVGLVLGGGLLSSWLLSAASQRLLEQSALLLIGVGLLLGTAGVYRAALRRAVIRPATVPVAVAVWAALSGMVLLARVWTPTEPVPVSVLFVGLAALAVALPATTPLALAWNRHR